MWRVWACLLTLALGSGCATVENEESQRRAVEELTARLEKLEPSVDDSEAKATAGAAVGYPLFLAQKWKVTPPAIFNNMLVNAGIHPDGLCFQWADALTEKIISLHLRTLEWHRGVARLGTSHEHSCVVLTAVGQPFAQGLALDAWRHCGRLHWAGVLHDDYSWKEVSLSPSYLAELETGARDMENERSRGASN